MDEPGQGTAIDFASVFRDLPSPYMILDADFCYVEVNDAYCSVVEHSREALLGRNLFDLFPNDGPSGQRLRDSFRRVLETGRRDSLPLIPYPLPRPESRGGGFEMRYWSAVHVPILGPDGQAAYVIQNTVDVTELQQLKAIAYGPGREEPPAPGETDLLQRAQEVQALNRTLAGEMEGLRDLFMQAPGFMCLLVGPELTFTLANHAYQRLIGQRAVIGKPIAEALPEVVGQGFVDLLREVLTTRTPYIGQATPVMLQRTPHGPLEERFVDFIYQPVQSPDGEAIGVFVEGSDVTDRVEAERRRRLLVDELNHRVKNTLATVQAIAAQTLRAAPDPESFAQAFELRLIAMSATHDLLTATSWTGARLRDVLAVEFKPYSQDRYMLDGPDVELSPSQTLALGLLTHELATNAAKYGALSADRGCVEVRWEIVDDRLSLTWTERDGPPVTPPSRRGFGSRLIERSLKGQLGGEAVLDFRPEGLVCRLTLPLATPG